MNKPLMNEKDSLLVSVVVCFFNEIAFLEEAIKSVFRQDYNRWELLLVDDGSTDESTDLAISYAHRYPDRVTYLEHAYHQNRGLSASRNLGVKKSRGSYVAFLDADDVWMPEKLRHQIEIFRSHPEVTVVLEASLFWNSWQGDKADIVVPVGAAEGVYQSPKLMLALYPLGKGAAPCPSGIMVQRGVLRRCPFEEMFRGILQMYEDQAFLSKVYLRETVFVSTACHNKYRQRPSSLVSAVRESGNYEKVRSYYLYWFRDFLHAQPCRYKTVERLLRRAQMPYREPFLYKLTINLPQLLRKHLIRALIRLGILNYSKTW